MESAIIIGQFFALLTPLSWAINSIGYRYIGMNTDPGVMASIRMMIAVPVMVFFALLFDGRLPTGYGSATYIYLLTSGAIGYFITDTMLFTAYIYIGARESLVFLTLSPITSAILSYLFLSQKLTLLQIAAIALILIGIVIMVIAEGKLQRDRRLLVKGILLASAAGVMQGVSYMFALLALEEVPAVSTNLLRNCGGLLAFLLYIPFQKNYRENAKKIVNRRILPILAANVVIGPALGMCSQMYAMTLLPVGVVSAIGQTSPILILPYELAVMKKKVGFYSILGTVISIVGVIILFF